MPENKPQNTPPEKREHPNDPLHGINLKTMLTELVEFYGWDDLAFRIRINCFAKDPSIKSSLTFLRKTFWAKEKVENLYRHFLLFDHPKNTPEETAEQTPTTTPENPPT